MISKEKKALAIGIKHEKQQQQKIRDHFRFPFFFLEPDDDADDPVCCCEFLSFLPLFFSKNPPFSSAPWAALLICLNRSEPSWVPPYHLVTATSTLVTPTISRSARIRSPPGASPLSSYSWSTMTPVAGSLIRQAQMCGCVALATRLSFSRKSRSLSCASAEEVIAIARPTNTDLRSVMGSDTAHSTFC